MRLSLLALFSLSIFACGGGSPPVCGNGETEEGEACDDGNLVDDDLCTTQCTQQGDLTATIIWSPLLGNEAPGFDESCGGVGADDIVLDITGPLNFTLIVSCGSGRTPIRGMVPGIYNVVGTLTDTDTQTNVTTPVTRGMAQTSFELVNVSLEATLDFTFADFINAYTGAFFFRTRWAMIEVCATAFVQELTVRLERGGVPLSGLDRDNNAVTLDGVAPIPCSDFAGASAYLFKDIEWGPAQITLRGLNNAVETHAETFSTFVGAGVSNPEMNFDVNSLTPDAGVDAI